MSCTIREISQNSINGYAPHNDVSVNDGSYIRRWTHKIILYYIILYYIILYYIILYYIILYYTNIRKPQTECKITNILIAT